MSLPGLNAPLASVEALEEAARASLFRRLLKNPTGLVSLLFLVAVVLSAILAPVLAPRDPNAASAENVFASPGSQFLLGADGSGHDNLSRLLFASRLSLAGALVAVVVASLIGVTAGLIAGYYGKWFETASSWSANLLMAMPGLVALLAASAVLGPSIFTAMSILGVLLSPAFYRLVSTAVSAVRNELYVDAARVSGLTDLRIVRRHVLAVVRAPAIILGAGLAGLSIALESGLDFLGFGDPTKPSWGGMLNNAFAALYTSPIQLVWPSLAIGLTCISLALLGNALRDEIELSSQPRKRRLPVPTVEIASQPVVTHAAEAGVTGEELLRVHGLSVGYDQPDGSVKTVVEDVSLVLRRGEVHGLIGESGSGKTQTAWSILDLLPAGGRILSGVIEFEGVDLASLSTREMTRLRGRKIAYVPQEPMSNLDPVFTIGHQLTEPMRTSLKISRSEARDQALALLTRVGIADPRRTFAAYPHQISGGMAQRVLIAGALSCRPDLLIADEPTTALDVTVQAEVLDLLRDLQKEFDVSILLVTHNFGVVADLCDSVSIMRGGRIVETGQTRAIFADPRHEYTRSLFAALLEDAEPRGPLKLATAGSEQMSGLVHE
jgi:peptide/nickel transport system permease protein